jgi:hypothetical protein
MTLHQHGGTEKDLLKGKFHPKQAMEVQKGEKKCSCTLSLASLLDVVGVHRHAQAA